MVWHHLTLELHQLPQDEVRRGWIRIHENQRGGIRAGELIKIKGPAGSALRVVYGLAAGYQVGGQVAGEDWICLDEATRDAIGLQGSPPGSMVTVSVKRSFQPIRFFQWLCYGLNHQEIPLKIGSWLALVSVFLGIVSLALGILSVVGCSWANEPVGWGQRMVEVSLAAFFRRNNPFLYIAVGSALFFGISSVFTFVTEDVRREQAWTWWVYQIWFNAVGTFLGWIAVYYLWNTNFNDFEWQHFLALVIAFFGVTGNLPAVSFALSNLVQRLFRLRD